MIRRILFTFAFVLLSCASFAQSAAKEAERAYASGKYDDAIQLYEMLASTMDGNSTEQQKLYDAANKCRKIQELHSQANTAYNQDNFKLAMNYYNQILKLNPNDSRANARKNEYNYKLEEAAWNKVADYTAFTDKALAARKYLELYPTGRYKDEAAEFVAEEELWNKALETNTYAAYKEYMENSELKVYEEEVQKALSIIDDEMWANVRRRNSKVAYEEYINAQQNVNGKHLTEARGMYNLMSAREYYTQKNYIKAYECYAVAEKYIYDNYDRNKMNECCEYVYYINACSTTSTIEDCEAYFAKYPTRNASHYYKLEEKMMTLLCKEGRFEEALKYARYDSGKKYVKNAKKAWRKAHR